jgi:Ni/Co efflux regulator RcnB
MMRKLTAVATLLVLGLVSGAASAQHDRDSRGYREYQEHQRHNDRHEAEQRNFRGDNDRHGYGYRHGFRRGDRLPYEYRSRQYVVEDWRHHRLSPPPRGYRWVQVGPQYMLVAIPTGIVFNVVVMQ